MNKLVWTCAALLAATSTSPAPARADGATHSCQTLSQGSSFESQDSDVENARRLVIEDCSSQQDTDPSECRFNARCDGDRPGLSWFRCVTHGAPGTAYHEGGSDLPGVRDAVTGACAADTSVANVPGDCRFNLGCEAERPGTYARCKTQSRGVVFREGGPAAQLAAIKQALVSECLAHPNSTHMGCQGNLSCSTAVPGAPAPHPQPPHPAPAPAPAPAPQPQPPSPAPQPDPQPLPPAPPAPPQPDPQPLPPPDPSIDPNAFWTCTTQSNGRRFTVPGRGLQHVHTAVIIACEQPGPGVTDPSECAANVTCQH